MPANTPGASPPQLGPGECRLRFETRPGLTTGPGLPYPPAAASTHAEPLRAPPSCPLRPGDPGPCPGLRHESPVCSSLDPRILIDPFLSDNPSRDNGWSGYLTGKNSTQGGDR